MVFATELPTHQLKVGGLKFCLRSFPAGSGGVVSARLSRGSKLPCCSRSADRGTDSGLDSLVTDMDWALDSTTSWEVGV